MQVIGHRREAPSAIRNDLGAIFVSLELSRSTWLITSLSPSGGEKMSKHSVPAGDICGLLARFSELRRKTFARTGKSFPIIVIQEAGLDGFWVHRVLQNEGIESHVVDPASIATSRRRRRTKTDRIDGEALLRTLLAYKRGEPRVCAMIKAPSPEEEDRRRLCRERKVLTNERVLHVNRIKGLLFSQGVSGFEPLRRDRRQRLDELRTGDGRPLPKHLKAQISRELDRLELLLVQIKAVEVERDALLAAQQVAALAPAAMLLDKRSAQPVQWYILPPRFIRSGVPTGSATRMRSNTCAARRFPRSSSLSISACGPAPLRTAPATPYCTHSTSSASSAKRASSSSILPLTS